MRTFQICTLNQIASFLFQVTETEEETREPHSRNHSFAKNTQDEALIGALQIKPKERHPVIRGQSRLVSF